MSTGKLLPLLLTSFMLAPVCSQAAPSDNGQGAILEDMHAAPAPVTDTASDNSPVTLARMSASPVTMSFTPVTSLVPVEPFRPAEIRAVMPMPNYTAPAPSETVQPPPVMPAAPESLPNPAPTLPSGSPLPGQTAANPGDASMLDNPGIVSTPQPDALPQDGTSQSAPGASPSKNVTVNLINLMVKRGLITPSDSADLISQAQQEALVARNSQPDGQPTQDGQGANAPAESGGGNENDSVNVAYIPDSVREQMRSQIEQDVITQARTENWAAPRTFPTWASRMTFFGDTRVRFEDMMFPHGNDNSGSGFVNYNAINTGAPLNNVPGGVTPYYNVDQNRDRLRLRARFGVNVALDDGFTTGLRVATGSDDNPVTENQTFGAANNGQGGDFSKYAIWLDRAFIKYQYGPDPDRTFSAEVGRFDNPFLHTSMIFANDLGFDGAMIQGRYKVEDGVTPFAVGGVFPVFNTDLNFASTSPAKFSSENKWLYAGQTGVDWKINPDYNFKGAVAFYDYETVEGKLSDPFIPLTTSDQGNTDDSRPSFAQNGNTYFPIRDLNNSTAANGLGTEFQYQYYGLATAYRELALTGQLDVSHYDPFHIRLTGEAVKNVSFDGGAVNAVAINNLNTSGNFAGGDMGYMGALLLGSPDLLKQWDWNINLSYRYVESDAVVDGFTDSDFGGTLTGTNLEGYTVGGGVALSPQVSLGLRWMSANAIAGPTYKNDLFQFDINSKF